MVGDTSQVHLINDGRGLTEEQRRAFAVLSDVLEKVEWNGQAIHEAIHKVKEDHDIAPKLLFPVLYRIFLYREDGPQMGWFLSTLDRKNVISSLNVISKP